MSQRLYVVTYFNRWPDDGFELGGVYSCRSAAKEAAENRECAEYGWEQFAVKRRELSDTGGASGDE